MAERLPDSLELHEGTVYCEFGSMSVALTDDVSRWAPSFKKEVRRRWNEFSPDGKLQIRGGAFFVGHDPLPPFLKNWLLAHTTRLVKSWNAAK